MKYIYLLPLITLFVTSTQTAGIFQATGNLVGDTGKAVGNFGSTTFTGERIDKGDRGPWKGQNKHHKHHHDTDMDDDDAEYHHTRVNKRQQ